MDSLINYLKSLPREEREHIFRSGKSQIFFEKGYFCYTKEDGKVTVWDMKRHFLLCENIEDFDLYASAIVITAHQGDCVWLTKDEKLELQAGQVLCMLKNVYAIKENGHMTVFDFERNKLSEDVLFCGQITEECYGIRKSVELTIYNSKHEVVQKQLDTSAYFPDAIGYIAAGRFGFSPLPPVLVDHGFLLAGGSFVRDDLFCMPANNSMFLIDEKGRLISEADSFVQSEEGIFAYSCGQTLYVCDRDGRIALVKENVAMWHMFEDGVLVYCQTGSPQCFFLNNKFEEIYKAANLESFKPCGKGFYLIEGEVGKYTLFNQGIKLADDVDGISTFECGSFCVFKNGKELFYDSSRNLSFSIVSKDSPYVEIIPINAFNFIGKDKSSGWAIYNNDKTLASEYLDDVKMYKKPGCWFAYSVGGLSFILSPEGKSIGGYDAYSPLTPKTCLCKKDDGFVSDLISADGRLLISDFKGISASNPSEFLILENGIPKIVNVDDL